MKLFLFLAFVASGCPHPQPPSRQMPDATLDAASAPPAVLQEAPSCPVTVSETPAGVCDGIFTADSHACVICDGGSSCIDHSTEIYCALGPCTDARGNPTDPNCHRVFGIVQGSGDAVRRIHAKNHPPPPPTVLPKFSLVAPLPKPVGPPPILPNCDLTPGVIDPRVRQDNIKTTICVPGYAKKVRPPSRFTNKIKAHTFITYGIKTNSPNDYELDHLISLELGGAPRDEKNLWPEPWETRGHKLALKGTGAESKDRVENWLHHQVCTGKISLTLAQQKMAANWAAVLREMDGR